MEVKAQGCPQLGEEKESSICIWLRFVFLIYFKEKKYDENDNSFHLFAVEVALYNLVELRKCIFYRL